MEEELQGGVCGENFMWNSPRNLFVSSPCSSAVNGGVGSFSWSNHGGVAVYMKPATTVRDDTANNGAGYTVLQKPHHLTDWNEELLNESGRSQENYSYILQALNSSMNCRAVNFCSDSNQSFPVEHPPNSVPLNPVSYLFDADSQSLLDYQMNSSEYLPSLGMVKPKQQPGNNFQFINNTPFWNAASVAPAGDVHASFLPSTKSQLVPSSLNKPNTKHHNEKVGNESATKRPRVETPSPLPPFKVRKEKLGDRVTALQQLVSPFGKTDTASVLHEAIEYIKLLHDQVNVLSTPYLKNGSSPLQCQKDEEETMKDLRSRGLCLVPIASTFPVAAETPAEFWTPTFGGSFR